MEEGESAGDKERDIERYRDRRKSCNRPRRAQFWPNNMPRDVEFDALPLALQRWVRLARLLLREQRERPEFLERRLGWAQAPADAYHAQLAAAREELLRGELALQ